MEFNATCSIGKRLVAEALRDPSLRGEARQLLDLFGDEIGHIFSDLFENDLDWRECFDVYYAAVRMTRRVVSAARFAVVLDLLTVLQLEFESATKKDPPPNKMVIRALEHLRHLNEYVTRTERMRAKSVPMIQGAFGSYSDGLLNDRRTTNDALKLVQEVDTAIANLEQVKQATTNLSSMRNNESSVSMILAAFSGYPDRVRRDVLVLVNQLEIAIAQLEELKRATTKLSAISSKPPVLSSTYEDEYAKWGLCKTLLSMLQREKVFQITESIPEVAKLFEEVTEAEVVTARDLMIQIQDRAKMRGFNVFGDPTWFEDMAPLGTVLEFEMKIDLRWVVTLRATKCNSYNIEITITDVSVSAVAGMVTVIACYSLYTSMHAKSVTEVLAAFKQLRVRTQGGLNQVVNLLVTNVAPPPTGVSGATTAPGSAAPSGPDAV